MKDDEPAEESPEPRLSAEVIRARRAGGPGLLSRIPGMAYQTRPDTARTVDFVSVGSAPLTGWLPGQFAIEGPRSLADLVVPADRDALADRIRSAVEARTPWELEYRIRTADGRERWVWDRGHVVLSTDGEVLALEGFLTDVTDRRELEESLLRSQKMEALGELTGSIAHDFNNLLTAIIAPVELLLDELGPASHFGRQLAEVNETAYRAASLTQQLLAFCRKQAPLRRVVDVNQVVERLRPTLQRLAGDRARLHISYADRTLPAYADPAHLEQVLVNLVVNARDAQTRGGGVWVTLGARALKERSTALGLDPGPYVTVSVEDDGEGIAPEVLERIFEPFFTTKSEGTGLGLATVYGIVTQHGGAIDVRSAPGEGSTFTVLLPCVDAPVEDLLQPRPQGMPPRGTGTVLLIEDDGRVRDALAEALRRYGYGVIAAKDGAEARRRVQGRAAEVDVIVSDVALDDGSGPEVVSALRSELPTARVIYVSGYADEAAQRRIEADPGATVLQKPFPLARLLEAVAAGSPEDPQEA